MVFIILSGLGSVLVWWFLPETKNIPLEEMAKLFGDEVAVYAEDLHVDQRTHELIVDEHGDHHVHRVATEAGVPGRRSVDTDLEKRAAGHQTTVEHMDSDNDHKA